MTLDLAYRFGLFFAGGVTMAFVLVVVWWVINLVYKVKNEINQADDPYPDD